MRLTLLTIVGILSLATSFGAETDSPVKVNTTNPAYATPEMSKNAHVTVDNQNKPSWDVSIEQRNDIFKKAGLTESITKNKMDELAQDTLFMDLKSQKIEQVISKYPKLPVSNLKSAQALVRKSKS
jgi:hypothetical protein